MTAAQKLVDFKISIESKHNLPVEIIFENKKFILKQDKLFLIIDENYIDKKIPITFKNFSLHSQICHLTYIVNGFAKPVFDNSCFIADKNSFMKINPNVIDTNGTLTINLSREWWQCNVFGGYAIYNHKNGFICWHENYKKNNFDRSRKKDIKNYDIVCVGGSATWGENVKGKSSWPFILQKFSKLKIANFGVDGLDHYSILHNAEYILNNYKFKKMIVQLGPYDFSLPKRIKIKKYYLHTISKKKITNNSLQEYKTPLYIDLQKYFIKQKKIYKIIRTICQKKINSLKKYCKKNKILINFLYTNRTILKYKKTIKSPQLYLRRLNHVHYQKLALQLNHEIKK
jgi:hypothetical protein